MVILNGHGGNDEPLALAAENAASMGLRTIGTRLVVRRISRSSEKVVPDLGGHAGEGETSLVWNVGEKFVDASIIPKKDHVHPLGKTIAGFSDIYDPTLLRRCFRGPTWGGRLVHPWRRVSALTRRAPDWWSISWTSFARASSRRTQESDRNLRRDSKSASGSSGDCRNQRPGLEFCLFENFRGVEISWKYCPFTRCIECRVVDIFLTRDHSRPSKGHEVAWRYLFREEHQNQSSKGR